MANFQERFNILFDDSDLSQEHFGNLFKATKNQVYNWRHGRGEPDLETAKLIANACNVSVDWLVGNTGIRTPVEKLAAQSNNSFLYELPPEAAERIVEFRELMVLKYGEKKDKPR